MPVFGVPAYPEGKVWGCGRAGYIPAGHIAPAEWPPMPAPRNLALCLGAGSFPSGAGLSPQPGGDGWGDRGLHTYTVGPPGSFGRPLSR